MEKTKKIILERFGRGRSRDPFGASSGLHLQNGGHDLSVARQALRRDMQPLLLGGHFGKAPPKNPIGEPYAGFIGTRCWR